MKGHLLAFYRRESGQPLQSVLVAVALSGAGQGMLMALANLGAESAEFTAKRTALLVFYIVAMVLYLGGLRRALRAGFTASEHALERVRVRLSTRLLQADLAYVERHAGTGHFTPLQQDTRLVADAMTQALYGLQSLALFAVSSVYMAWKSPTTFGLVALVFVVVLPKLMRNYHRTTEEMRLSAEREGAFFGLFGDLVQGFKEVKLNRARSQAIQTGLAARARQAHGPRHKVNQRTVDDLQFSSGIFYVLLAVLVFVLPEISPTHHDKVEQTLSTVLFLMGPLTMFATTLPMLARAEAAVAGLYTLEAEIDAAAHGRAGGEGIDPDAPSAPVFERLGLHGVSFHYTDAAGEITFRSGPHEMEIHRGELVFIVGGNGSGKSTLLKLLTGLYAPLEGELRLDGATVDAGLRPTYRELFSIVFTDFHLFDRLYGLESVDPAEVQRWLTVMGLEHKTRFEDGRFTQTALSTGQRKRLAFIVAVLRDKPVCILDEVAADQDPGFRQRFYRELLPELRARGTTVIVVSHDDAYFDCADRLIRLQDGRIVA
ncbi:cyclic peptide export ABC transporter [Sphaerotilus sp.]|uniref:cyclic peptide export ABC transporter n=1 Tax=Sphaerotilus sp. TaxID=2093942 RepID=UPI00286E2043|nr:cyclic peptide export ABC transporter [Sphaerotilus sp.]